MKGKKKEAIGKEEVEERENASPVCYVNSSELREEFIEPGLPKPAPDQKKPKDNSKG